MKAALFPLFLAATPALADDTALIGFMGGQGCTFGPDSRAAAITAGHDASAIDALITASLKDGRAKQEGAYTVLNAATCTIRLPDIASNYTVNSPEIVAITSAIDAYAAEGAPGCFLVEPFVAFDALKGKEGAGYFDTLNFLAAAIISGDLRFYGTSPLTVPPGFQVVTGACADLPDITAIRRNHDYIVHGFGPFIRALGATTPCARKEYDDPSLDLAARLQGVDPKSLVEDPLDVNAWLWMEYTMIALAAGWREDMTGTEKGTPRPPLCHYPKLG